MSYTPLYYTGDGAQTDFSISWDYILEDHVEVYLSNVQVLSTTYSFPSTGVLRFDSAPGAGVAIEIRRSTPASPLLVEWEDGAPILGADLNKATKQAIYAAEEATFERTVLIQWQNAWTSGIAYEVNDAVGNDGSSFICIASHTSTASDEPGTGVNWTDYWDVIAEKGATGPSGPGTGDMVAATYDPAGINQQLVGLTATQTLTNKTLTAPTINSPSLSAGAVDAITEIAAALRTGDDTTLVTGSAGGDLEIARWNGDGDLVSTGKAAPTGAIVGTTDTQTLTNKTLSSPTINVGADATGDMYYRTSGGVFQRLPAGSAGNILTMSGGIPAWTAPSTGEWTAHANNGVTVSSGADYTFSSIPSGIQEFMIGYWGVTISAVGIPFVRLGDSGGIEDTGYLAGAFNFSADYDNGTLIPLRVDSSTTALYGVLHGFNLQGNVWWMSGHGISATNAPQSISGAKTLTGTLDRILVGAGSGAQTFTGGTLMCWYK